MPELRNHTPYPNFRYYSRDHQNREFGSIIVKATYELAPSGRLLASEEQAPMVFTDLCHGDVNVTSLWHPSDLVPNKPATDIIVNATARSPGGIPCSSWECGLRITDKTGTIVEKILCVTGPRHWVPLWKRELSDEEVANWQAHRKLFDKWQLSQPDPIVQLPLRYEYAFGGEIPMGHDEHDRPVFDTDVRNPLGRGKINKDWTNHTLFVPAPQIENRGEPVTEPYRDYTPEGLGPIPPAWHPRHPLGGTYDQNWMDNVWPKWPADYTFDYHNSAHPDLIITPYLRGNERIDLAGLSVRSRIVGFALPGESMFVDFIVDDGGHDRREMNLDTIFLDISNQQQRDWRVHLSWRVNFEPDVYDVAVIHNKVNAKTAQNIREAIKEGVAS